MDFVEKIKKIIKMRHDDVVIAMTNGNVDNCLLYTSPSPRDATLSRMPSSA